MSGARSIRHVRREWEKLEKRRLRSIDENIKAGQKDRAQPIKRESDTSEVPSDCTKWP